MKERSIGLLLTVAGIALAIFIVFFKTSLPSSSLVPVVLIVGPWLLVAALLIFVPRLRGVSVGALFMLVYECLLYYQVFFASESSTAGMDYMFKWVIQLVVLLPIGTGIGWVVVRKRPGTEQEKATLTMRARQSLGLT